MSEQHPFAEISPTTLADLVERDQVADAGIGPLWSGAPRFAGPAYVVRCGPGENLMMHAAIHRAAPGSVIVVQAGDRDFAVAGGNVCAVAQRNGIAGLVVDGMVRDVAEIREMGFGVHARGVIPKPGRKTGVHHTGTVLVGGVEIGTGDIILADEEGIVVAPAADAARLLTEALAKQAAEDEQSLDDWEAGHRRKVDEALRAGGDPGLE